MFTILDLPIIIALFAAIFGTLGLISLTVPVLRRNIPNLKRGSILYLISAGLLVLGVFSKNNYTSTLLTPELALAGAHAAVGTNLNTTEVKLWIEPKISIAVERSMQIMPQLDVTVSTISVSMVSDPSDADVFINGKLRGQTPLTLSLPKNTLTEYRITASPDIETGTRYAPFKGFIHQDEASEISIWLERIYQ